MILSDTFVIVNWLPATQLATVPSDFRSTYKLAVPEHVIGEIREPRSITAKVAVGAGQGWSCAHSDDANGSKINAHILCLNMAFLLTVDNLDLQK